MDAEEDKKKVFVTRKVVEAQRYKIDKLMKNPEKPVYIPEKKEEKEPRVFKPPEFIRNIWGSSAGVGSGDFHIYRNMRRRQNAREKYMDYKTDKERLDAEYQEKVFENIAKAGERTCKKREKRLKMKQKQRAKKLKAKEKDESSSDSEESENEDNEEENTTEENYFNHIQPPKQGNSSGENINTNLNLNKDKNEDKLDTKMAKESTTTATPELKKTTMAKALTTPSNCVQNDCSSSEDEKT